MASATNRKPHPGEPTTFLRLQALSNNIYSSKCINVKDSMAFNVSEVVTAFSSMNVTANCSFSTTWLNLQQKPAEIDDINPSINTTIKVALLRAILPPDLSSRSDAALSDFYDQIAAAANPALWLDPTIEGIQSSCLAPALFQRLSFADLDLTRNCSATAAYYANTACAINGPQSHVETGTRHDDWGTDRLGDDRWIVGHPPPFQGINSSAGLAMLKNALPSRYGGISDVELAAWADLALRDVGNDFANRSQINQLCKTCTAEFCLAAGFTGNPDIGGIGALVSYLTGAGLVTLSFIYFLLAKIRTVEGQFWEPIRSSTRATRESLLGGAMALALSLSIALFVLLVENNNPTTPNSYYQELMAENATYLSFYALMVLGAYFPFTSLKGAEFGSVWMVIYYLVMWIQVLGLFALLLGAYGNVQFGDEFCIRNQLGSSSINDPSVYSICFVIIGSLSRTVLVFSYLAKAIGKIARSRSLALHDRRQTSFGQLVVDEEALSLLLALPLLLGELILAWIVTGFLGLIALRGNKYSLLEERKIAKKEFYGKIAIKMDHMFAKAKYGAWVLSIISIPLIWLEAAYIVRLRHAMMLAAGSSWVEDQVGFGQILALLIWMPVIVGFTLTLMSKILEFLLSLVMIANLLFEAVPARRQARQAY